VKQGEQHTEERALEVESLFGRTSPNFQSAKLRFHHESILRAQWPWPGKYARNLIERVVRTMACLVLLRRWHLNVRDLDSDRRLTGQRKHLVNGNTGSDNGVTHRSFADLTLNVCSTYLCNIRH
jgi:hypothetical protein